MEPKNQHDMPDLQFIQSILYRTHESKIYDMCASIISITARASTFSTITYLTHNNLSLVRTPFILPVPHCGTNETPPQSNGQSPSTYVTPTANNTSRNNSPK